MSTLQKSKFPEAHEQKDSNIKNTLNLGMQESKILSNPPALSSEVKNNGSEIRANQDPKAAQAKPAGGTPSKSPSRGVDTAADLLYMQNVVEMLQCLRSQNYSETESFADTAMKVNQSMRKKYREIEILYVLTSEKLFYLFHSFFFIKSI